MCSTEWVDFIASRKGSLDEETGQLSIEKSMES
jgi:hypothetical protein